MFFNVVHAETFPITAVSLMVTYGTRFSRSLDSRNSVHLEVPQSFPNTHCKEYIRCFFVVFHLRIEGSQIPYLSVQCVETPMDLATYTVKKG